MTTKLRLERLRPWRRDGLWSVTIEDGRVAAFAPHEPSASEPGTKVLDCGGRVMLPALADVHVHLDKTLTSSRNESGTLEEAIGRMREIKRGLDAKDYRGRARRALAMARRRGCVRLRTHVDVSPGSTGLDGLRAILDVRSELPAGTVLQVVALGSPGESELEDEALREAMRLGADFVGGCPALASDMKRCVAHAFDIAAEYDRGVDLHVDETDDPEKLSLELIAEETIARGMQGRVTAGHCCSLDFVDDVTAERVITKVAEARVDVVTLPSCNLNLIGRGRHPAPRGLTRVRELREAGVRVAAASDNVRDPFNPLGCYDPVKIANLLSHAAHMTGDGDREACIEMVSSVPAAMMGLSAGLPGDGESADFVVFDIEDPRLVLAENPAVYRVVCGGVVVTPEGEATAEEAP